jgi:hypothetical protein
MVPCHEGITLDVLMKKLSSTCYVIRNKKQHMSITVLEAI